MEQVKVSKSGFTTDVNNGMTTEQLVEKYGISKSNVKNIAKQLELTIKRNVKAKYVLIDDTTTTENLTVEPATMNI